MYYWCGSLICSVRDYTSLNFLPIFLCSLYYLFVLCFEFCAISKALTIFVWFSWYNWSVTIHHNYNYSHNNLSTIFKIWPNKNSIFSCSYCSCTIFVLISYPLDTQVMLIFILIYVLYSQKAPFSFEKGSNGQNLSSSGSHHPVKRFPQQNFWSAPYWGDFPTPTPYHFLENLLGYIN